MVHLLHRLRGVDAPAVTLCISRFQPTSSFGDVERNGVGGGDDGVTLRRSEAGIEEERNRTALRPRVEHRSGLRVPRAGSRDDHAHDCSVHTRTLRVAAREIVTNSTYFSGGVHNFTHTLQCALQHKKRFYQRSDARRNMCVNATIEIRLHRESENKTLNSCPQLPQLLTDFQFFWLTNSVVNLRQIHI